MTVNASNIASSFNFRHSEKYEMEKDIDKGYGLRIFIVLNGKGGKFDFSPLFLSIGSGII